MVTTADKKAKLYTYHANLVKEKYRRDIVYWLERNYYVEATPDREAGLIDLMPHQRVILRFMFRRVNNQFMYDILFYSTIKKSGKTCIGGGVCRWAAETWGKRNDIYCVGNDANQAKEKIYQALKTSVELNPEYNPQRQVLPWHWLLRDTQSRHTPSKSIVHAVATDYKGEAGANPILTCWTELWGMTDKAALRFWAEMAPSPTRPFSMRFIETYAGFVGESELLEGLYETVVVNGRQLRVRDLKEALGDQYEEGCFEEALSDDDYVPMYINDNTRMCAYWDTGSVARRMPWQRGEHGQRYYSTESGSQTESQFRRLHLNEWVSAESEFVPIEWWDACLDPMPLQPGEKTPLVVSLDAAVTGDCFGLSVVSRDPRGIKKVIVRMARKWSPPEGGKIDFHEVAEVLRWLRDNFNVLQVCYDPYQLEFFVATYREELGLWFEDFQQGERRLRADKQLYDLIAHQEIGHDGDINLREHIQNCNAKIPKDDDTKLRIIKKSDTRKIDLAVALSMASAECLRLNI